MRADVRTTARIRIAGRPSSGDTRRGREHGQASDADRGDFSQHRGRSLTSGGIFTEAEATTKDTKHTEGAHSAPSLRFAISSFFGFSRRSLHQPAEQSDQERAA